VRARSGKNTRAAAPNEKHKHVVRSLQVDDAPNDQRATDQLARQVMGWRAAPDRFVKSNRGWIPKWRFQPFSELADAFQLLDNAARAYTLTSDGRIFTAEVEIGDRRGKASGKSKARTVSLAVARALGIEVDR
jgi:hypothetical protein